MLLLNAPTKRAGPGAPLAKGPFVASVCFPEPRLQGQVGAMALPLGCREQLLTLVFRRRARSRSFDPETMKKVTRNPERQSAPRSPGVPSVLSSD